MNQLNSKPTPLRILLLEDDPYDAELIIANLEAAGYACIWKRVEREAEFVAELQRHNAFDVILADYNLPNFNALAALDLYKKYDLKLPFILVSGTVGEELAVDGLKAGATDYVLKDRLFRLGAAVNRALLELETKQAQMQAQMQAYHASKKLEELINTIDGIVWEADPERFTFTFVSAQATRLLGYPLARWLTESNFWIDHVHPDDQHLVRNYHFTAVNQATEHAFEHRMIAENGRVIWLHVFISVITEATQVRKLQGIMIDITNRKITEAALQESEASLREAQNLARLGSWRWDIQQNHLEWSDEMYNIYELDPQAMPSIEAVRNLIHPEDLTIFENAFIGVESGDPSGKIEYRIQTKSGLIKHLVARAKLEIDDAGTAVKLVGTVQDITERKQLEEQLRLSQKMDAVGQFTAGIAHDFNNILTSINGSAELIQMRLDSEDPLRRLVNRITRSGQHAADLIAQLMAFSRKQLVEPTELDLSITVKKTEEMLRRIIGEHIQLQTILPENLWLVLGDATQFEQIIVNLAVNARDAMPDGGNLKIKLTNHTISARRPAPSIALGDYVLLTVQDSGIGMSKALQDRIFEPFFSTKPIGSGTGLGLATVYGIIKQLEGEIVVNSIEGKGTQFDIYIPRLQPDEQSTLLQLSREHIPSLIPMPKGSETILLVEDDNEVRQLTLEILTMQGYNVLEAQDGEAALNLTQTFTGGVDLLLTDVIMPQINGRELAMKLKTERPDMKVIYMSGYTDNVIAQHGILESGMVFIQKPFTPIALSQKIRQTLDA